MLVTVLVSVIVSLVVVVIMQRIYTAGLVKELSIMEDRIDEKLLYLADDVRESITNKS